MVALHVVGIDFEHRTAQGLCLGGGAEVSECLVRHGLLRSGLYEHLTLYQSAAFAGEDLLVEHVGGASFSGVFDEDVLFHTFVAIGNHCTGNVCLSTLAQELDVYLSFVVPTAQGEGHQVEPASFVLFDGERDVVLRAGSHVHQCGGGETGVCFDDKMDVVGTGRELQELRCLRSCWNHVSIHFQLPF